MSWDAKVTVVAIFLNKSFLSLFGVNGTFLPKNSLKNLTRVIS
jgi:hypothetical protein